MHLSDRYNNGAESYHAKITTTFKSNHPNIWNFCETFNDIITDSDIDIARLNNGLDISRSQKREQILKGQQMESCKQKLSNGIYTPSEYIDTLQSSSGVGKLFSEGAALLCPNFERARICIGLLMHHLF